MKPVDNGCPLTMYSVYYREIESHETRASWQEVRIDDNLKTHHVLPLRCDAQYAIEMSAWNELGQGNRSRRWNIKTNSGTFPRSKYLDPFVCFVRESTVWRMRFIITSYTGTEIHMVDDAIPDLLPSSVMCTSTLHTLRYFRWCFLM